MSCCPPLPCDPHFLTITLWQHNTFSLTSSSMTTHFTWWQEVYKLLLKGPRKTHKTDSGVHLRVWLSQLLFQLPVSTLIPPGLGTAPVSVHFLRQQYYLSMKAAVSKTTQCIETLGVLQYLPGGKISNSKGNVVKEITARYISCPYPLIIKIIPAHSALRRGKDTWTHNWMIQPSSEMQNSQGKSHKILLCCALQQASEVHFPPRHTSPGNGSEKTEAGRGHIRGCRQFSGWVILPQTDIWQCLQTFLVVTTEEW